MIIFFYGALLWLFAGSNNTIAAAEHVAEHTLTDKPEESHKHGHGHHHKEGDSDDDSLDCPNADADDDAEFNSFRLPNIPAVDVDVPQMGQDNNYTPPPALKEPATQTQQPHIAVDESDTYRAVAPNVLLEQPEEPRPALAKQPAPARENLLVAPPPTAKPKVTLRHQSGLGKAIKRGKLQPKKNNLNKRS
jgi:hypothetical protein